MFSFGERQQLLPFAPQMWTNAAKLLDSRTAAASVTARKFAMKLVQRIGLTFLPATVAAWRYQQTSVNINDSLKHVTLNAAQPDQDSGEGAVLPQPLTASSDAANGQLTNGQSVAHSNEMQRPALQPSHYVNVQGPLSPSAVKPAHSAQAMQQQHDTAERQEALHTSATKAANGLASEAEEEDDAEVPDEIEEVGLILLDPHQQFVGSRQTHDYLIDRLFDGCHCKW